MAKCHLIIDSCCDLPASVVRRPGVTLMKFPYTVDGGTFEDDLFESVSAEAFYGAMRKGAEPSTAQVTLQTLTDTFTAAAEEGTPAVYLAFSSGLSASFDAACVVRDQVLAEHPDFELHIVDTHLASVAEGLLVYEALVQHEKGMSAAELAAWAEEARCFVNEEFMVDDLEALRRGGRIPASVAVAGAALDVKPLLVIAEDGTLSLVGVARGAQEGHQAAGGVLQEERRRRRSGPCRHCGPRRLPQRCRASEGGLGKGGARAFVPGVQHRPGHRVSCGRRYAGRGVLGPRQAREPVRGRSHRPQGEGRQVMAKSYAYVGAPSFIGAVEGRLADAGFSQVSDVASADIVVTYATSGSALEDLYFGDEGLVTTTAPGSTLVDLSAATPNFAREINAVATVNDLVMVEAPATVRSLVAADAFARENLLGPVATEAELTDDVRRLLDAIFGEVVEVGAPGRAQLLRNTHTLPLAADLVSAIEAVALDDASARSVGALDADQIPLFSPVSADPVVQAVRQQRYTGDYTAEMLLAELSAALMAADDAEVILPGVEATMHLLELLVVIGGADMAPAALSLVYQDEAAGARAGLDWTRAEQAYGHPASEEDEDWSAYDDEDGCGHDHFREDHDYDDYDDFAPYNDDFDYSSN